MSKTWLGRYRLHRARAKSRSAGCGGSTHSARLSSRSRLAQRSRSAFYRAQRSCVRSSAGGIPDSAMDGECITWCSGVQPWRTFTPEPTVKQKIRYPTLSGLNVYRKIDQTIEKFLQESKYWIPFYYPPILQYIFLRVKLFRDFPIMMSARFIQALPNMTRQECDQWVPIFGSSRIA